MFSSSSKSGCTPFDTFIASQAMQQDGVGPSLSTPTGKPSSRNQNHHLSPMFLHSQPNFCFHDHDNELQTTHFLTQDEFLRGSCSTFAESSAGGKGTTLASSKKAASALNDSNCKKKKKKRGVGSGDGATARDAAPRKRLSGKKDRHSKIYTAQGPRDRRMRLSLQIARKFFDLQDMLGFDKASKTIEWLFSKSRASIRELKASMLRTGRTSNGCDPKTPPSDSDTEDIRIESNEEHNEALKCVADLGDAVNYTNSYKSGVNQHVVRESRDKARARARERTMEKMKMRGMESAPKQNLECQETNFNCSEPLIGSSSPIQAYDENFDSCSLGKRPSIMLITDEDAEGEEDGRGLRNLNSLEHQMDSVSIIEKFLGITGSSRSSSIFDYSHIIGDFITAATSEEIHSNFNNGSWEVKNDYGHNDHAAAGIKGSTSNVQVQICTDIPVTNSMTNPTLEKACSILPSVNPSNAYGSNVWSDLIYGELTYDFEPPSSLKHT